LAGRLACGGAAKYSHMRVIGVIVFFDRTQSEQQKPYCNLAQSAACGEFFPHAEGEQKTAGRERSCGEKAERKGRLIGQAHSCGAALCL